MLTNTMNHLFACTFLRIFFERIFPRWIWNITPSSLLKRILCVFGMSLLNWSGAESHKMQIVCVGVFGYVSLFFPTPFSNLSTKRGPIVFYCAFVDVFTLSYILWQHFMSVSITRNIYETKMIPEEWSIVNRKRFHKGIFASIQMRIETNKKKEASTQ